MKNRFLAAITALLVSVSVLGQDLSNTNDFNIKGFHIDLRAEVMTLGALKDFAAELAGFGINTIVMEWEATFPFDRHATISNRHSFSPAEISEFVSHCTVLGVDVIPLQHCFGHVEYILRHDRYSPLKEDFRSEISQICPLKPGSKELFRELFAEVAALHPSEYFHIGGDETFLLGLCSRCSNFVEEYGKSKLFVDYIVEMCRIVSDLGKRPVLWADIITKYPEAVGQLPEDAILVDWNYGWDISHFGDMNNIYASGLEIWGAPSIRCSPDNYCITDWTKHFENQEVFIPYGRRTGYNGMIMTSWSTSGLYGLFLEPRNEVTEMDPVRMVYPMNGFRILIALYGEALATPGPADAEGFVIGYAQERFRLSAAQGQQLWDVLNTPQPVVRFGKDNQGRTVEQLIESTRCDRDVLYAMRPKSNRDEFEHFKLMFDLRLQYLELRSIEAVFNSPDFHRSIAPELLDRLERNVMSQTRSLDRRFIKAHKGYLKDAELPYLNDVRVRRVNNLYNALKALV